MSKNDKQKKGLTKEMQEAVEKYGSIDLDEYLFGDTEEYKAHENYSLEKIISTQHQHSNSNSGDVLEDDEESVNVMEDSTENVISIIETKIEIDSKIYSEQLKKLSKLIGLDGFATQGRRNEEQDTTVIASIPVINALQNEELIDELLSKAISECVGENFNQDGGATAVLGYLSSAKKTLSIRNLGDSRLFANIKYIDPKTGQITYKSVCFTEDHDVYNSRIMNALNEIERLRTGNSGAKREVDKSYLCSITNSREGVQTTSSVGDFSLDTNKNPDKITINLEELVKVLFGDDINLADCEIQLLGACDGLTESKYDKDYITYDYQVKINQDGSYSIISPNHISSSQILKVVKKGIYFEEFDEEGFSEDERLEMNNKLEAVIKEYLETKDIKKAVSEIAKFAEINEEDDILYLKELIPHTFSRIIEEFESDNKEGSELAEYLVKNSYYRGSRDNIACVLATIKGSFFSEAERGNDSLDILLGVFDGHGRGGEIVSESCREILERKVFELYSAYEIGVCLREGHDIEQGLVKVDKDILNHYIEILRSKFWDPNKDQYLASNDKDEIKEGIKVISEMRKLAFKKLCLKNKGFNYDKWKDHIGDVVEKLNQQHEISDQVTHRGSLKKATSVKKDLRVIEEFTSQLESLRRKLVGLEPRGSTKPSDIRRLGLHSYLSNNKN